MQRQATSLQPFGVTDEAMVFSNFVYVNPAQNIFSKPQSLFPIFVRIKSYIFSCGLSDTIPAGKIGMNRKIRECLSLSLIEHVSVELYENSTDSYMTAMEIEVELALLVEGMALLDIDDKLLSDQFKAKHAGKYFKERQIIPFSFQTQKYLLQLRVLNVKPESHGDTNWKFGRDSQITFKMADGQKLKMKSQKQKTTALFQSSFKIEDMDIGGLDAELTNIFRRAFASRRFPPSMIQKFGIKHVKGILLFGPPGTGKTLIARQLAKSLKAKELKIVNGPEVFGKYVGESEENVRKLFVGAREDEKKFGDQSPLHIIVFDEIDAICKKRGTTNDGTNAHDLVVNQLLTNIDGVESLNNIIVIGMTNRKDLIDEAVLRPGRFEVHIEVGLPNQQGRQQILKIHTKTLKANNLLGSTVDIEQLAIRCKNFTGAEIEALVKSATSFAMARSTDIMDFSKKLVVKDVKVEMKDFEKALEEVKPQFGVDEEKFDVFLRGKLYNYGPRYNKILDILNSSKDICLNGEMQLNSVLLEGDSGTGKTSIASFFARKCTFPFVKLISPEQFVGSSDQFKINQIVKVFEDAYRSKQACIIIDNLERLLEYIDLGPRFSNDILQTFLILLKRLPKKPDSRLLIIGTTSSLVKLYDTGLPNAFNLRIHVPKLDEKEICTVLAGELNVKEDLAKQVGAMFKKERVPIRRLLQGVNHAMNKGIEAWREFYDEFQATA